MKPKTLVVDNCFFPILIVDWKKAMQLLCLKKAEVVENHEEFVSSPTLKIRIPSILRILCSFKKPRKAVKFTRSNVFVRDQYTCQYCGVKSKKLTIDHIIPRAKGGKNEWTNVCASCTVCQTKKGCQTLAECGMKLLNKPRQPTWHRSAEIKAKMDIVYPKWGDYLFV